MWIRYNYDAFCFECDWANVTFGITMETVMFLFVIFAFYLQFLRYYSCCLFVHKSFSQKSAFSSLWHAWIMTCKTSEWKRWANARESNFLLLLCEYKPLGKCKILPVGSLVTHRIQTFISIYFHILICFVNECKSPLMYRATRFTFFFSEIQMSAKYHLCKSGAWPKVPSYFVVNSFLNGISFGKIEEMWFEWHVRAVTLKW